MTVAIAVVVADKIVPAEEIVVVADKFVPAEEMVVVAAVVVAEVVVADKMILAEVMVVVAAVVVVDKMVLVEIEVVVGLENMVAVVVVAFVWVRLDSIPFEKLGLQDNHSQFSALIHHALVTDPLLVDIVSEQIVLTEVVGDQ